MLEWLMQLDRALFLFLNGINHPFVDPVMVSISGRFTWIPLYLILVFFITRKFQWETVRILLFVAILISLSDQISVQAFKLVFQRLRPCHEPELQTLIHIVNGKCGGSFGFVSSHATNSFALATFLCLLFSPFLPKAAWYFFGWASLVSYSRIYLGVHYPGDILAGGIVGILIGFVVWKLYLFSRQVICRSNC
jgi:undecaprenyl-diphosphatase